MAADTYTDIQLHDERAAINSLPQVPDIGGREDKENFREKLRTGTDDKPIGGAEGAYKPAYKKLTENAYSGFDQASLTDIK